MVSALRNRVVLPETKRAMAPMEPSTWREVGWIFREGEILTIRRFGNQTRVQKLLL
jgi:hypothetical protein